MLSGKGVVLGGFCPMGEFSPMKTSPITVLSHLLVCDNACKSSLAIQCERVASCPVSMPLSVPSWSARTLQEH